MSVCPEKSLGLSGLHNQMNYKGLKKILKQGNWATMYILTSDVSTVIVSFGEQCQSNSSSNVYQMLENPSHIVFF